MDTLIPFTRRHPKTQAGAPCDATWVDVSGDRFAYWRTLCEWWERGETFTIIEHDVVCRPDIIDGFITCDEPWCLHPYDDICHQACMEAWANMLGCTRFDAGLIAAVPDACTSSSDLSLRDWHNVCDGIGNNLRAAGFTHHWHEPPVWHHHMDRPESRVFAPPLVEMS